MNNAGVNTLGSITFPVLLRFDYITRHFMALRDRLTSLLLPKYYKEHYSEIMKHESCIENRVDDGYCTMDLLKSENKRFREGCERNGLPLVLIEDNYEHTVERMLT